MIPARIATNPWTAAALGSAGTLTLQALGPLALASGWTAPVLGSLLGAAAAGVMVEHELRARRSTPPRSAPPPYVRQGDPEWALGLKPSEWIASVGAAAVPDAELEGFLRARLSESLSFLPPQTEARWEEAFPKPIALLALAFAARASGRISERRDAGGEVLCALRVAMGTSDERSRATALAGIRSELQKLGDRASPLARHYLDVRSRHATRETFMMGLLQSARQSGGVLASAEFTWLKGFDRPLWYALNNLGRRRLHVEGIAAMAHYRAECAEGRPCAEPRMEDAIEALAAICRDGQTGVSQANIDPWERA